MIVKGGRLIDPASGRDALADIVIAGGRIEGIFPPGKAKGGGGETIDATGLWVLPGLIDMHAHLREPGQEYKEDIASGSAAAAAGGITTVVCMANTDPVNDNPTVTRSIIDRARAVGLARVLPAGAITMGLEGRRLAEMGLMKRSGIVAVSDDGRPVEDASVLRRALEYASTFGLPVILHSEDKSLAGKGVMNEGPLSARLGLPGIPAAAEEAMVCRDLAVARYAKTPVHITHVSTGGALAAIGACKETSLGMTCDVTPHHLLLTEEALSAYDTVFKVNPPLRTEIDRLALLEGFRNGPVDCIATDHAPHAADEKALDFDLAPFGVIGFQTLLPAIMKIHLEHDIPFMRLLACVTTNPARILGIEGGVLFEGARADLVLFDPKAVWTLTEDRVLSKSKNSPFLGWQFTGKVVRTLLEGRTVHVAD
ncbi:MAG TPA: dihydroorotase [Deltaproteobacteria bacterium]|nr:dihydroorotase [Deltaproteobacteria bacterium]